MAKHKIKDNSTESGALLKLIGALFTILLISQMTETLLAEKLFAETLLAETLLPNKLLAENFSTEKLGAKPDQSQHKIHSHTQNQTTINVHEEKAELLQIVDFKLKTLRLYQSCIQRSQTAKGLDLCEIQKNENNRLTLLNEQHLRKQNFAKRKDSAYWTISEAEKVRILQDIREDNLLEQLLKTLKFSPPQLD